MSNNTTEKINKTKLKAKSKEIATPAVPQISAQEAAEIIIEPYITEKTFNLVEKENKITFIVDEKASKTMIRDAIKILYEADTSEVTTARTIQGKKAFVKFKAPEGARDLATKLGLV